MKAKKYRSYVKKKTLLPDGNYKLELLDPKRVEYHNASGQLSARYYYDVAGKLHREDGPAVEWADGYKAYYIHGLPHREDGPAVETADGGKKYYIHGQRHREDGPAVDLPSGYKAYYIHGQYHRLDGPAVEYVNGDTEYWLNDKQVTIADMPNLTLEDLLR